MSVGLTAAATNLAGTCNRHEHGDGEAKGTVIKTISNRPRSILRSQDTGL